VLFSCGAERYTIAIFNLARPSLTLYVECVPIRLTACPLILRIMHIVIVSSAPELYRKLFRGLQDIMVYAPAKFECQFDNNTKLDVVFFDAQLGQTLITQYAQFIQQKKQTIKWLVIGAEDVPQALLYLQLGASGILRQVSEQILQDCLQTIATHQLYLDTEWVQILALRHIKKILLPFKTLTAREYDVFCMLAEGYSIAEIAEILLLSTKTAFNCQTQVRKKLNLKTQAQFYALAKKHGLVN